MYDSLLSLPYFQGMSRDDITAILGKTTFEFKKYAEGDTVYNSGDKYNHFAILTSGTLSCTHTSPDGTYCIKEQIPPPYAIEPYSLFGYDTTFKCSYTASDNCTILTIAKQYLFTEFTKHDIFTINFLNLISRKAQKNSELIWHNTPTSIIGRIVQFIAMRCETQSGIKQVNIKMERLATILCETRLNISKALNELQERGLIELHRGAIAVQSLQKLISETKEL